MRIIKISFLSFVLLFASFGVLAKEELAIDVNQYIALDEKVTAKDFNAEEPTILPDSPFYFFKEFGRGIQSLLTFDQIKKTELKVKFANEKLIEVKKLVEGKKDSAIINKGLEEYQEELEKIEAAAEKIKKGAAESQEVSDFLDKFIKQQLLHRRVLQKIETQVPAKNFIKIQETKERHLEEFAEVMTKLENRKDQLQRRLETKMNEVEGSGFKDFKNLEILKELEEKVPEAAKEAIQNAAENYLTKLRAKFEQMEPETLDKFIEYTDKISGAKEKQFEILEDLKSKVRTLPSAPKATELKERLEEGKEKILEAIEKKLDKLNCPLWVPPAPGFCKEGKVIIEKDPEAGCSLPPRCETSIDIGL